MTTPPPPPGWYPDPSGAPGVVRYWDGAVWSQFAQPAGAPPQPPLSARLGLASYGRRLGGWLIDLVVVGVIGAPLYLATHAFQHTHSLVYADGSVIHENGFSVGPKGIFISALVVILYGTVLCGLPRGQTIGMMATRIRVVDIATRGPIGPARALLRAFIEYVLAVALFLPWVINMLFPLWDANRQTLHDKASRAIVVDADAPSA